MANNKAVFELIVDDKGRLKLATKDVASLGSAVEKTKASHERGEKAARNYHNTQEKGIIGTANGTKSFSKLRETIGSGDAGLVGAYATLAANIFAVSAAFNALRNAAQAEQVMLGLEASGARAGRTLSVVAQQVKELTSGALSMEEASRATAQLNAAGFGSNELLKLTQVANDTSFALGRNLPDAMERLTRGVTKLEPELLDELGIMVRLDDATDAYAVRLGRTAASLTNFERRQAFMNAVLAEGEQKFGGLSGAAGDTRGYDNLGAAFSDLSKTGLGILNDVLLPLANFFGNNSGALSAVLLLFAGTIAGKVAPSLTNLGKNALIAANNFKTTTNATASLMKQFDNGPKTFNRMTDAIKNGQGSLALYERTLKEVNKSITLREGYIANPTKGMNVAVKKLELDHIKQQKAETEKLIAATYKYRAERSGANAAIAASEINLFNISRQGLVTFKLLGRAHLNYSRAAIAANGGVASSFTRVIAAAQTARVAFIAAGSAMLSLIPVAGQIYLAGTLIYSAYEYLSEAFAPEGLKEYKAEIETLNSILESSTKKREEYLRLQKNSLNVAQQEIDKTVLLGNAIGEIAAQLEKTIDARKRVGVNKITPDNILQASLSDVVDQSGTEASATFTRSFIQGLQTGSLSKGVADGIRTSVELAMGSERTEALKKAKLMATEEFKSLDAIYNLGNDKINRRILNFMKEVSRMPVDKQAKEISRFVRELEATTGPLLRITQELSSAFSELETSSSKLITGSKISTPFDDQARAFDSVVRGVKEYQIEVMKGNADTAELGRRITEIGAISKNFLSLDAQNAREAFMKLNAEVVELEANLRKATDEGRGVDALKIRRQIASVSARRDAMAPQVASLVSGSLAEAREFTLELQRQSREYQSQLAVLQSQNATVTGLYAKTAQGLRLQYEQEERVRAVKVAQLELEKTFIERTIAKQKQELISLQVQEQILNIMVLQAKITNTFSSGFEIQLAQLQLQSEAIKSSIRDEESALRNLANQQQAINNENLTDAQKQARYNQRNIELVNEYNSALQEQSNIIQDLNLSIRKIERIRSGSILTVRQEFEDLKSAAEQQIAILESTTSRRIASLRGDLQEARANAEKMGSQSYASEQISVIESQIKNEGILLEARKQQVTVTNQLQMLEKARFDVTKEGLEWQQKSLEYMERELEISRETQDAQNRIFDARRQINLKKSGLVDTEEGRRAQEIRVATANYNLALQEVQIKEALIDLEYGLLDAQRLALAEELKARAEILGPNSRAYGQLQNTIKLLEKGSYTALAESQKRAARLGVEAMRAELENLVTLENPWAGNNGPLSFFKGLKDLGSAMSTAQGVLKKSIDSGTKIITDLTKDNSLPDVDVPTIAKQELLKPPLETLVDYVKDIRDFIQGQIGVSGQAYKNITELGEAAKAMGLRTSGFREAKGHRGRGHPEGRALDINAPGGIVEADSAQYKAMFDKLATEWAKKGFVVLWNNKRYSPENIDGLAGAYGHRDHIHVEEPRSGLKTLGPRAPLEDNSIYRTPPTHDPNQVYDAANDNEIVVRARTKVSADMYNRGGIEETIQGASQLGDLNIPEMSSATQMWGTQLQLLNQHMSVTLENLAQLGPEGQILSAVIQGSQQMYAAILAVGKAGSSTAEQMTAWGGVASAALSMINGVVQASANAKVAAIDREIDAEQRRDGKSAESVAKIQAMEKRKDQIAKKAFDTNKKIMMAQAIIATATGVAQALSYGPPGIPLAIAIGALGAAQLAIIAGTSYQSTASKTATAANIGKITVGRRGSEIDLAKPNKSPGGEIGYLRGTKGYGTNSSNYTTVGRAYGGGMPQMVVGEKGPEKLDLAIPMRVKPIEANDNQKAGDTYQFNIQALDAKSVEELFMNNGGSLIASIRNGANASGQPFLEGVSVPQLKSAVGGGTKY